MPPHNGLSELTGGARALLDIRDTHGWRGLLKSVQHCDLC